MPDLTQYRKNTFFVDNRVAKLPQGAVVVSGTRQQPVPARAPASVQSARYDSPIQSTERFITNSELLFEPESFSFQPESEAETESPAQQEFDVFNPFRYTEREVLALGSALRQGERDENKLTNRIFSARHPERVRQAISRSEPDFGVEPRMAQHTGWLGASRFAWWRVSDFHTANANSAAGRGLHCGLARRQHRRAAGEHRSYSAGGMEAMG